MVARIIVSVSAPTGNKQAIVDLVKNTVMQEPLGSFKEAELCDLLRPYLEDYLDRYPGKKHASG
jgi:hypothetical protein